MREFKYSKEDFAIIERALKVLEESKAADNFDVETNIQFEEEIPLISADRVHFKVIAKAEGNEKVTAFVLFNQTTPERANNVAALTKLPF